MPTEIRTVDPPITDTPPSAPADLGLRAPAQHAGPPRCTAGVDRAWAGLFNTHFFVDHPMESALYTNSLPFIPRTRRGKVYGDFEAALYASL
ncbi:hypothetical protein HBB16_02420 [Pseudonocardia sp. MCCB 268]|nr:hypothetical protein [Pseudonocardia cytotoxica]